MRLRKFFFTGLQVGDFLNYKRLKFGLLYIFVEKK